MRSIYLAGPFSWQERIKQHALELDKLGYVITARWLSQESTFTNADNSTIQSQKTWDQCQLFSVRDIEDIIAADTLILFEPGTALERNTRVAEFGGALFTGKQCIVIGPEDEDKKDVVSNIFVKLTAIPQTWRVMPGRSELNQIKPVIHYRSWSEFICRI